MSLAKFEVSVNEIGIGKIVVNDDDISNRVTALRLDVQPGNVPVVSMVQRAGSATIDGEGIVRITEDAKNPNDYIVEFLDGIDPEQLSKEVLGSLGWGDSNPMETALKILKLWAGGIND